MTEETVMSSPERKKPTPDAKKKRSRPREEQSPDNEQNQATKEEFEEEGMGVAPKE